MAVCWYFAVCGPVAGGAAVHLMGARAFRAAGCRVSEMTGATVKSALVLGDYAVTTAV